MKQLFRNQGRKIMSAILVLAIIVGLLPGSIGQVEAAYTEVELDVGTSGFHAQDAASRYLIYLDADGFDETTLNIHTLWANNTILIDGEPVSSSNTVDDVNYHIDSNQLLLTVKYHLFGNNATTASGIGKHQIIIPKGTVIGETIRTTKDIGFDIDGANISKAVLEEAPNTLTFTNTKGGAWQGNQNRWLTYLANSETVPSNGTFIQSGLSITVKGGESETEYELNAGDLVVVEGKWALLLNLNSYPAVPTPEQTDGKYYTVILKAGNVVDNKGNTLTIAKDVPILYSNGEAQGVITGESSELITALGSNKGGMGGIYFDTTKNNGLPYNANWSARPFVECGTISIDETFLVPTSRSLVKTEATQYYFSFHPDETGGVPNSLEIGSELIMDFYASESEGSGKVVYFPKTTFVLTESGWEKKANKTTVAILDDVRNENPAVDTKGGFYFSIEATDGLDYNENWSVRYNATQGGVYVGEELKSSVQLIKLTETLYYVALSDAGITPARGMQITVEGTYGSGSVTVQFMAATFVYDGSGNWKLGGSIEEENWSEAPYEVYDIYDFLSVSTVTVPNDRNFNLLNMGKTTGVGLKAKVTAEYKNAFQDITFTQVIQWM